MKNILAGLFLSLMILPCRSFAADDPQLVAFTQQQDQESDAFFQQQTDERAAFIKDHADIIAASDTQGRLWAHYNEAKRHADKTGDYSHVPAVPTSSAVDSTLAAFMAKQQGDKAAFLSKLAAEKQAFLAAHPGV